MKVLGYVLEMLAVFMFISTLREVKHKEWLADHGTAKGKRYAIYMKAVAVGIRCVCGTVLLIVGLWMVGAFR
jgi:hypothetical protein